MPIKSNFPLPGLALAVATAAGMVFAGADWLLAIAVLVLWLGSLWLSQPEPEQKVERQDATEVSRDAVHETIEPLGQPLILLESSRIVDANAAARSALGAHILGQDARIALRHPAAM
ncbi:MAG: two-component sensor histidine kinase, partial [Sphingomonadales bacterium]|nr:two-component sensor histidine kinase [Sphingomonadales bacterium]